MKREDYLLKCLLLILLGQVRGAKDLWEEMVCVCVLKLIYKESVASNENNRENDVSGIDYDFMNFYDE
jgi:hypothetical protein